MTVLPLAHVSHWLVNVLYLVPLVLIVGMLAVSSIKDRRAEAAEAAGSATSPAVEPDENAAP